MINDILLRFQGILGMKQAIRILSGSHIDNPSIYGFITPKLLLPPALLLGVPVEQLEAIIAHELAHIRRHDYLVNLAQQIVEAALFFNPAVWWINRQIRVEREACCDRLAVEVTGKPEAYAWSLKTWAENQRAASLTLAPAFGASRNPGGPLERLQRLLVSEFRPAVRLPWSSLVGLLSVAGALFFGLCAGTQLAVGFAAEWLTPQQRLERMAHIEKAYGYEQHVDTASSPAEMGLLTGTVEAEDGALIESNVALKIISKNRNTSRSDSTNASHGRFEQRVLLPGWVYLGLYSPGYAPAFLGPFETKLGEKVESLRVVLHPGVTARIQAMGKNGNPLPGAEIGYQYEHPTDGFTYEPQRAGPDGVARFAHLATNAIRFKITAPGYQYDERELTLPQSADPYVWRLTPATPSVGTVAAAQTGQPVPGASVRLMCREGIFPTRCGSLEVAPVLAFTDDEGKFQLDSLNDQGIYELAITAPGFAPFLRRELAPGQTLNVALEPQVDIRGTIIGDLSTLTPGHRSVQLHWQLLSGRNTTYANSRGAKVKILDGIGYFEFDNVFPGRIDLDIGRIHKTFDASKSIENVVLDLNEAPTAPAPVEHRGPQCTVVLKVRVPQGYPSCTGSFSYVSWSAISHRVDNGIVALTNGVAQVVIPSPGGLSLYPTAISGYWIEQLHHSVGAGTNRVELSLDAIPAGSIYGKVIDSDGSEASDTMVAVIEAAASPLKQNQGPLNVFPKNGASTDDGPTRFSAQPLPLGGKYVILAYRHFTYAASEPMALSEAQPIRRITLKLPPGTEVRGQVLDDQGHPVPRAEVSLTFTSDYGPKFGGQSQLTDTEGGFRLERVNPQAPGSYTITVRQVPGCQAWSQQVNFKRLPLVIALEKGMSLEGTVLDLTTGLPIPKAKITATSPGHPNAASPGLDTITDAHGRFKFTELGPESYRLLVEDAVIEAAAPPKNLVRGGQAEPVILRVNPIEGGRLKPARTALTP